MIAPQIRYYVHNFDALNAASAAHSDALETVRNMGGGALVKAEVERVMRNVNEAFALGERDPLALKIAGVHGLLTSRVRAAQAEARGG